MPERDPFTGRFRSPIRVGDRVMLTVPRESRNMRYTCVKYRRARLTGTVTRVVAGWADYARVELDNGQSDALRALGYTFVHHGMALSWYVEGLSRIDRPEPEPQSAAQETLRRVLRDYAMAA